MSRVPADLMLALPPHCHPGEVIFTPHFSVSCSAKWAQEENRLWEDRQGVERSKLVLL